MNARILAAVSTLVVSLFGSMLASAQTPGPIHKWSGDGNGYDNVGTAHATNVTLPFTTGHSGQAFSLDGTVFPDFGSDVCAFGSGDFTIDFWIQTVQTGNTIVFSRRAWCSDDNILECAISAGTLTFKLSKNPDLSCVVQSSKTVNDGSFHHVAIVRRSLDLAIYIDGVLDGLATASQVISITTITSTMDHDDNVITAQPDFVFGWNLCSGDVDGQFVGALDEVEVYDRALDDTEVYWLVHPGVQIAIVNQPFNQRTLVGRSVVFHVTAVGLQPITYQWRFNGSDIPGAISNNLVIATPMLTDSGSYYCVIDNPAGGATSQQATLVVTNLTTPSDALMARWSGEGTPQDSIGTNSGVANNVQYGPGVLGSSFKFKAKSDIECPGVLNDISTNDFTIDFWMATSMSGTPVDEYYPAFAPPILGDSCYNSDVVGFRCGFYKPPRGASNCFVCFEIGPKPGPFPGTTSGNLPAFWHSFLDDPCRPDTSASPIQVNDRVFHHIAGVRKGRTASIYLDGRWVQTAMTSEPIDHSRSDLFFLGGYCSDWDGGGFPGQLDEVQVHNRALSDAEIYNEYSPDPTLVILRQPLGADVVEGTSASCSVLVAGLPPYTYQWQHNGMDISGATDSALTIANAAQADGGTYTVTVGNALETLTSSQAILSVLPTNSLLPGLVNLWTADGNANDCVGHAENRTFNARYAPGISGEAFDIAAYPATIDEHAGNFGTNDFTISLWVKSFGWSHNAYPTARPDVKNILSKSEMELDRFATGYALRMTNGAILFCGADADGHQFNVANPTPSVVGYGYLNGLLDDAQFHHIAAVRRSMTNLELYVDATLIAQTNMPALTTLDNNEVLALNGTLLQVNLGTNGGWSGLGRPPFNGHVDEIELYNRALTTGEITGLYQKFSNNPQVTGLLQRIQSHVGDVLTLSPQTVTGPGPLSYQWTFNGIAIADATKSTLSVTVDGNSAGDYALVVSNPSGSVTCPAAAVTLALSPGSYNGLFYLDEDPADDSSGYVSLTVTSSQTYSGSILQHGHHYSFTGRFSGGQAVSPAINRPGKAPLHLNLTMPTTTNLDQITGVVNDGQHIIPLKARRAVYAGASTPQAGEYTMQLTGIRSATAPNGHGFGNISIGANGLIKLRANLADGTPATQGSAVVANSGEWPLYVPLYRGKGSMLGWLSFTNAPGTRCAGQLRWVKASNAGGKNYRNGFATKVPVIASTFTQPASGLGINLTDYKVVLDGAKIYTPVSNQITNLTGNVGTFAQTNARPGKLNIKTKGLFTGTFTHPVTKRNTTFHGIVLQEQGEAAGYFISGNLSGRMVLQHK